MGSELITVRTGETALFGPPTDGLPVVPVLVAAAGERAAIRFLEFFAGQIQNANTRAAYARAAGGFLAWCEDRGIDSLTEVQPLHVAAWIEQLKGSVSVPTVKLRLAAIRHLFDWLVTGHIMQVNPAAAVRGPKHVVRKGKTPVLDASEVRTLLDSINGTSPIDLRDRALIGLMLYSFARIGAVVGMKVEDFFTQNRRQWIRLHEKGGKLHDMPCNHNAEAFLHAYIDGTGIAADPKGALFRSVGRDGKLTGNALHRVKAFELVRKRAAAAGIGTKIGNHSFRATGINVFRKLGGSLENAALMANHASTRTTQLYDRKSDEVTLDEVERIRF
jgi:site-specific recombinase XerD